MRNWSFALSKIRPYRFPSGPGNKKWNQRGEAVPTPAQESVLHEKQWDNQQSCACPVIPFGALSYPMICSSQMFMGSIKLQI